ncbi:enhancer of split M1 protein [Drosophila innubila]|uniref:enhancer of split M1 protein n=1 Tax=Drosophila innubila TaxID=198719 RepID=UPI00148D6615|nr:enhancer of split M1 protein [Drosophila innubila]
MRSQALSLCCLLALLSCIAATTVSNNETDCPQICPSVYKPVCGSDGFNLKEFASLCNLKASNCRRERNAQSVFAQTDMAWCSSEQVENLHEKLGSIKLDVADCLKPCGMIYQPICVSNGKYRGLVSNECALETFNCALQANGAQPAELLRILRADTC